VIREILAEVQEEVLAFGRENAPLFDAAPPVLRAISPLAEGTDRIFAEQALDLGWELCCVMPFPQEEFERDFAPAVALESDSLGRFRGLLQRAASSGRLTRFQLDGSRKDEGAAYGVGGRVVLNQSDLLVVVWDGERQGKRGGTEETMDLARRSGVPVICVHAHAPHERRWIRSAAGGTGSSGEDRTEAEPGQNVQKVVRESLGLPRPRGAESDVGEEAERSSNPRKGLERFYTEKRPSRCLAVLWKIFRDVVGDSAFPRVGFRVPPFEEAILKEWPRDRSTPTAEMVDTLRPYYAWADRPSVLYADRYRSAFILAFLFAAVAVAMALTPLARGFQISSFGEHLTTVLELLAIAVVLAVVWRGRAEAWHKCWIDYRLAAELFRHLRVVAPVGGPRPFPQVPAYLATLGQPTATWMDWYVRAVSRSIGLPNAVVDRVHLTASMEHLEKLLIGQSEFHKTNTRRCWAIEKRLHNGIVGVLVLTLAACLLHFFHLFHTGHLLAALSGFLPALGAAFAGINNQGEFRRIARRSEAMQAELRILIERVGRLQRRLGGAGPEEAFAAPVIDLAGDAASLLVQEVLDWRIVVIDRPLEVTT
jgi:hypothetical protein